MSDVVVLAIPAPQVQIEAWNLAPGFNDLDLVELWLHGRPVHTQRAYRQEAARFLAFLARRGIGLRRTGLRELQTWGDSIVGGPATCGRGLAAIKSLLSFGNRIGYLQANVGAAVKLPPRKETLAERILTESEVLTMLSLERHPRNRRILRTLYYGGLRVSELTGLCWRDLVARSEGGQLAVYGKGSKTRFVLLPPAIWIELNTHRGKPDEPVFEGRIRGKGLHRTSIERLVLKAARRAGLEVKVSPHWLRHSHATHAIERGAPIHLVQQTLGHSSVATTGRYLHARPSDSSGRFLAQ